MTSISPLTEADSVHVAATDRHIATYSDRVRLVQVRFIAKSCMQLGSLAVLHLCMFDSKLRSNRKRPFVEVRL